MYVCIWACTCNFGTVWLRENPKSIQVSLPNACFFKRSGLKSFYPWKKKSSRKLKVQNDHEIHEYLNVWPQRIFQYYKDMLTFLTQHHIWLKPKALFISSFHLVISSIQYWPSYLVCVQVGFSDQTEAWRSVGVSFPAEELLPKLSRAAWDQRKTEVPSCVFWH